MSIHPGVMEFGGAIRIISPDGSHRIRASMWPELHALLICEPEPELLAEWVGRIEADLGVTDAHRQALADRAVAVVGSSEQKRRRLLEQSMRATTLNAPMRDPDVVRLISVKRRAADVHAAAAGQLSLAGAKKFRKQIKRLLARAAKLRAAADDARTAELDQDRIYGEAKEPILRAKARGDDVSAHEAETADFARDEYGAKILHRRRGSQPGQSYWQAELVYSTGLRAKKLTGIEHAFANGHLDGRGPAQAEKLREIGKDYRTAYEIAEGLTSTAGGEGGGGFGPKAPQPRLVEAGEKLAAMRSLLNTAQRDVLDRVCGKDERLRDIAPTRGTAPSLKRRLRMSLKLAAEGWARELAFRKAGKIPKSADVKAIAREIGRIRL